MGSQISRKQRLLLPWILLTNESREWPCIYVYVRLMRGDIDKAMQMSFVIWRISNAARCQDLLFNFLPVIAYGMMLRKQVVEYGNILNELWYIADQDIDNSGNVYTKYESRIPQYYHRKSIPIVIRFIPISVRNSL